MENTTRKYSTNTYEYYKNMIEMEVGWLEVLASLGKIKNINSIDLESKLAEIKQSLIDNIDDFLKWNNTGMSLRNYLAMKDYLISILEENYLDEVIPYVSNSFSYEDYSDLVTMTYIRKFVKTICSELRNLKEKLGSDSEEVRTLNTIINTLATIYPEVYLESSEFSDSYIEHFVGEMGVKYNKEGSANAYTYMALMLLERINAYICYLLPSEYEADHKAVSTNIKEFNEQVQLNKGLNYNVSYLTSTFDRISNNVELLKNALSQNVDQERKKVLEQ